ncbi:glycosyltransferase [Methylocella tundrae]|uniref:glycosyltransferase n=1 Tax=Methylocella tundrae TaxID=227605 RepID=UPI00157ABE66|nr:glycosyltransferase [Methylocella tundrae]
MILLTVGMQLPFDRLVGAVDRIAVELDEEIFGQIGDGSYVPVNFAFRRAVAPAEFEQKVRESRVIISHAGIGSLIVAKKYAKPIVFFPRRAALGEHRNDHQLATCSQFEDRIGVYVAYGESELREHLKAKNLSSPRDEVSEQSRFELIENIKSFIGSL